MPTTIDREAATQDVCRRLVEREVLHRVSSLVDHFVQHPDALDESGYDHEDILDLTVRRTDPSDWDVAECRDWLKDRGEMPEIDEDDEDEWRDAVRDADQDEPTEVYEHWAVTKWFADKLREHGETVGDLFDFHVWGRTTTGQAIYMDGIIRDIAEEMEILPGQRNDWPK